MQGVGCVLKTCLLWKEKHNCRKGCVFAPKFDSKMPLLWIILSTTMTHSDILLLFYLSGDWLRKDCGKIVPRNGKYEITIKRGKTSETATWGKSFIIKIKDDKKISLNSSTRLHLYIIFYIFSHFYYSLMCNNHLMMSFLKLHLTHTNQANSYALLFIHTKLNKMFLYLKLFCVSKRSLNW